MDIVDVEDSFLRHCYVGMETPPLLPAGMAQVKGASRKKRKTTQKHVAIDPASHCPCNPHPVFHTKG
ncbi:MAG: hypothetical protein H6Q54_446, partial [Deltaproteobacteria bacterium]|nr:hypothetical protein [Deltaproteobacteria bacterium]